MVSIIISEINGWNNNYCKRTMMALIIVTALCGISTFLRPELCFLILTGIFIWIGLVAGKQSWSEAKIEGWAIHGKQTPVLIITGKIVATIIITLIHFVILTPVLILTNAIWGIPWSILGGILFGYAVTAGLMAALGMLGTLFFGDNSEFPRKLFSVLFLVATCIPGLWTFNPALQILNLVTSKSPGGMLQFIPNITFIFVLLIVAHFRYPREVN